MTSLTQQQKVQKVYNLIGEWGLYVNTGYDLFTKPPEELVQSLQGWVGYIKWANEYKSRKMIELEIHSNTKS